MFVPPLLMFLSLTALCEGSLSLFRILQKTEQESEWHHSFLLEDHWRCHNFWYLKCSEDHRTYKWCPCPSLWKLRLFLNKRFGLGLVTSRPHKFTVFFFFFPSRLWGWIIPCTMFRAHLENTCISKREEYPHIFLKTSYSSSQALKSVWEPGEHQDSPLWSKDNLSVLKDLPHKRLVQQQQHE